MTVSSILTLVDSDRVAAREEGYRLVVARYARKAVPAEVVEALTKRLAEAPPWSDGLIAALVCGQEPAPAAKRTFYARFIMTPQAYPIDASLSARRRKHIAELRLAVRAAWDVLATRLPSDEARRRLEASWTAIDVALDGASLTSDDP
jgi:hypothetical protein